MLTRQIPGQPEEETNTTDVWKEAGMAMIRAAGNLRFPGDDSYSMRFKLGVNSR
jgi:hypothetical protein